MRYHKCFAITLLLALMVSSCGGNNFALDLQIALAAAPPLIDSLPVSADKKALIQDFTDIGTAVTVLSQDLKAATTNSAKLAAVERADNAIEPILARGHFTNIPKLQVIEGLIHGIIASAKIYYGQQSSTMTASSRTAQVTPAQAKADMERQIKQLKVEMGAK